MPRKVTDELKRNLDRNLISSVIIEIDPTRYQEITSFLNTLDLPVKQNISLPRLNLHFVSTFVNKDVAYQISDLPYVLGVHYDREYRIVRAGWGFPVANAVMQRVQPLARFTPKPGQYPTGYTKKLLGGDLAKQSGIQGKGNTVSVCDTGAPTYSRQFPLGGVGVSSAVFEEGGYDVVNGHGPWCEATIAGQSVDLGNGVIIEGMAPEATLNSIRCLFTPLGAGLNSQTLKAMQMAIDARSDIVSMSLGAETSTPPDDPQQKVIREASKQGVIFCIAAGNSGPTPGTINSPGDVEDALTVGSMSITDKATAYFSSRGPTADGRIKPDCVSFGGGRQFEDAEPDETIISSSTGLIDILDRPNKIASIAGTSMATPHVAGLMAWWKQYYAEKTGQVLDVYKAKDVMVRCGQGFKNYDTGWGLPTYEWIVEYLR